MCVGKNRHGNNMWSRSIITCTVVVDHLHLHLHRSVLTYHTAQKFHINAAYLLCVGCFAVVIIKQRRSMRGMLRSFVILDHLDGCRMRGDATARCGDRLLLVKSLHKFLPVHTTSDIHLSSLPVQYCTYSTARYIMYVYPVCVCVWSIC